MGSVPTIIRALLWLPFWPLRAAASRANDWLVAPAEPACDPYDTPPYDDV